MAATIKIKNSSTAGAAPTASDLVQGELAVNVTDKRLYTENSGGTIVELGTNPSVPVTFPDGSASAPSLTNDGDTNTGLFFPAADTVGITTGGTERARVDSSGNLGFGITPSAWGTTTLKAIQMGGGALALSSGGAGAGDGSLTWNGYYNGTNWIYVYTGGAASRFRLNESGAAWFTSASGTAGNTITFTQAMTLDASGNLGVGATSMPAKLTVQTGGRYNLEIQPDASLPYIQAYDRTGSAFTDFALLANNLRFYTGGSERARIDSSGNLLVGTTDSSPSAGNGVKLQKNRSGLSEYNAVSVVSNANNAGYSSYELYTSTGTTGYKFYVLYNGGISNFSANNVNLSDRREKTDFEPAGDYLAKICAIPVQTFNYINQGEDDQGKTLGVVAQDVQAVAPELVTETKLGTDGEGETRLAIYQTDLQYALMKCIQEQQAIIESLTARITALEA